MIHIPLNKKMKNFLNSSKLRFIKQGSVVINTSEMFWTKSFSLVEKKKISYFTDVISDKVLKGKETL